MLKTRYKYLLTFWYNVLVNVYIITIIVRTIFIAIISILHFFLNLFLSLQ